MIRKLVILLLSAILTLPCSAQKKRVPVIPVQFQDSTFCSSSDSLAKVLLKAAGDYFDKQFAGADSFSFEIQDTITLSKAAEYYTKVSSAVSEACSQAAKKTVSFPQYDCDSDGYVDNVFIIFAGSGIWPMQGNLSTDNYTLHVGVKKIDSYCVVSEQFTTGLVCHEYAHHLGMKDLYDTDGKNSGGISEGMWGSLNLMDSGYIGSNDSIPADFTAIEFHMLGLGQCDTLSVGDWRLEDVSQSHHYLYYPTDYAGEYYLFEAHQDKGMLVYHIDQSKRKAGFSTYYDMTISALERWERNEVNCRPDHQCADIVEADPSADTVSRVFFPQPGHSVFSSESSPEFVFWSGKPSTIALRNIKIEDDGAVTFVAVTPITIGTPTIFQDACIVNWDIAPSMLDSLRSTSVNWVMGDEEKSLRAVPDTEGHCHTTIEGLTPGTAYSLTFKLDCGSEVYVAQSSIVTLFEDPRSSIPFIYLNTVERLEDGAFKAGTKMPLRIFNGSSALKIDWFFNDSIIRPESNGLFTLAESGTLKAVLYYEDGSHDIITKKIIVR